MLFANRDSFISSLLIHMLFISFSCIITLIFFLPVYFSLSFRLGNVYCSLFQFTDSFLCLFHSAVESTHWVFCFHFVFFSSFVSSLYASISLLRFSFFFSTFFKGVHNCCWNTFYHGCLKSLSDNSKNHCHPSVDIYVHSVWDLPGSWHDEWFLIES